MLECHPPGFVVSFLLYKGKYDRLLDLKLSAVPLGSENFCYVRTAGCCCKNTAALGSGIQLLVLPGPRRFAAAGECCRVFALLCCQRRESHGDLSKVHQTPENMGLCGICVLTQSSFVCVPRRRHKTRFYKIGFGFRLGGRHRAICASSYSRGVYNNHVSHGYCGGSQVLIICRYSFVSMSRTRVVPNRFLFQPFRL